MALSSEFFIYRTRRYAAIMLLMFFTLEFAGVWLLLNTSSESAFTSFSSEPTKIGVVGALIIKSIAMFGVVFFAIALPGIISDLFRMQPLVKLLDEGIWIRGRVKKDPIPWSKIRGIEIKKTRRNPLLFSSGKTFIRLHVLSAKEYIRRSVLGTMDIEIYASHLWAGKNLPAEELLQLIEHRMPSIVSRVH